MKALLPFLVLLLAAATTQGQLYEARAGSVSFEKRSRDAVQVQVEATADWTRDYWQRWLKDNYKIKLKGNGVLKVGKSDYLTASQVLISSTTNQFVDLYSTITAPSDTVAELSVWAATGPETFLAASGREFGPMRDIVQRFATAARLQAIRDGVNEAEKALAAATKDKEKLERSRANLAGNTKSNLARIEQLHQQNAENKVKSAEDSVKLLDNARLLELRQAQLERNRTRLLNLDRP